MKKWIALLLVIPIGLGSFGGEDVGKLDPVQVVMITQEKNMLQIETDSGQKGRGSNPTAAVEDLMKTSSSKVFLDTTEYLLLEPGTEQWLLQLGDYLRPSCHICYVLEEVDLQEAGAYLKTHPSKIDLRHYEAGKRQLPTLIYNEGRMTLVQS